MLLFTQVWDFLVCQKSLFFEKRIICVFIKESPYRWDFVQNEHVRIHTRTPRTRRCTIHPCTLTTALTQNTNSSNSVNIWISLATVCVFIASPTGRSLLVGPPLHGHSSPRCTLSNPCKKKGASIMVAAGLCIGLDGVGHVFPRTSSRLAKINAARYQDMLRSYYDPWAKTFCGADAVFQQDGAPLMFRETLVWPALSPDLSPNGYALCGLWESLENPTDATTLRAAIIKTHANITSDQIKHMIQHFTRRLRLCLAADGGYFAASLR